MKYYRKEEDVHLLIDSEISRCPHCQMQFVYYAAWEEDWESLRGYIRLLPQVLTDMSFCPYCGMQAGKEY